MAYVVGRPWQGQGFAKEATAALLEHLTSLETISTVDAWISADNSASEAVAASLRLTITGEIDDNGERHWSRVIRNQ